MYAVFQADATVHFCIEKFISFATTGSNSGAVRLTKPSSITNAVINVT